jgi:hypothetical protein
MSEALSCFITDDRREIPTLRLVVGASPEAVRNILLQDMRNNPHYLSIEVRDADELLFVVGRDELAQFAADKA